MTVVARHRHRRPQSRTETQYERFRSANPDFVARLVELRQYRAQQMLHLGATTGRQRHSGVRRLVRDRDLHLLYAYEAVRRCKMLHRATPASIAELATGFNAFCPVMNEAVTTRRVDKGSGRRWVQEFGPRRRMQQALAADILRQIHPPLRTQTLFNGGMPTARDAVAAAYREGFTHGVELDFENFYGSVGHERLADLLRPLPTSIVDNVVWDFAMRDGSSPMVVVSPDADPTPSALTGLSLGASTSPIVGERIIAEVLAAAQCPETITYADNLFVMGRSREEVDERIHRIKESIASLNVGRLGLRVGHSIKYDLTRSFEFMKQDGEATPDGIKWKPSASKVRQYMVSALEGSLTLAEIEAAERRVRHWRRAYPDWPDGDAYEAEYLAALAVRRFYEDRNASHRTSAVHAILIAVHAWEGLQFFWEFIPTEGDPSGEGRQEIIAEVKRWLAAAEARRSVAAA